MEGIKDTAESSSRARNKYVATRAIPCAVLTLRTSQLICQLVTLHGRIRSRTNLLCIVLHPTRVESVIYKAKVSEDNRNYDCRNIGKVRISPFE